MRITQGMFSFLPDLTDDQIAAQIRWFIDQGWAVSVEFTDDPHPRNTYWEMWGQPMFDLTDPAPVMTALDRCRAATPDQYVRLVAFDARKGYETVRASFIVQRPGDEPGFHTVRAAGPGRTVRYSTHAYAADRPAGGRYR